MDSSANLDWQSKQQKIVELKAVVEKACQLAEKEAGDVLNELLKLTPASTFTDMIHRIERMRGYYSRISNQLLTLNQLKYGCAKHADRLRSMLKDQRGIFARQVAEETAGKRTPALVRDSMIDEKAKDGLKIISDVEEVEALIKYTIQNVETVQEDLKSAKIDTATQAGLMRDSSRIGEHGQPITPGATGKFTI